MGSSVGRSYWRAGEHCFYMAVRQHYLDRRRVRPGAAPIALCVLPSCCAHRLEPPAAERADRALCTLVCAGTFDATSSSMPGELLPPRLPCLPAHVLTYSRLACPWSQALDRRDGQHQVNLLFGLRRRAEPPEAAATAPRRPVCSRRPRGAAARGQRLAGGRACARRSARRREGVSGGVRSPCRGGRSSCGRPLGREPTRRGRRQGGPVGQPRRPHCGAFSGAWTDAGIGVACAGVAVDPGAVLAVLCVDLLLQV